MQLKPELKIPDGEQFENSEFGLLCGGISTHRPATVNPI